MLNHSALFFFLFFIYELSLFCAHEPTHGSKRKREEKRPKREKDQERGELEKEKKGTVEEAEESGPPCLCLPPTPSLLVTLDSPSQNPSPTPSSSSLPSSNPCFCARAGIRNNCETLQRATFLNMIILEKGCASERIEFDLKSCAFSFQRGRTP